MARISRRELKTDEVASRLAEIQNFFLGNRSEILKGSAAAALLIVVVFGGMMLYRSRVSKADDDFAQALAVFRAPAGEVPPEYKGLRYKSDNEKYGEALKKMSDVAERYSWLSHSRYARYYMGLSYREVGKFPEAEKELNQVAGGRDRELAALARMALAGLYEQTGKNDDADKIYRDLENHPTTSVPKAFAQLSRADLYQRTKPAEAKVILQQIQKDYAGLTAGDAATKSLEELSK